MDRQENQGLEAKGMTARRDASAAEYPECNLLGCRNDRIDVAHGIGRSGSFGPSVGAIGVFGLGLIGAGDGAGSPGLAGPLPPRTPVIPAAGLSKSTITSSFH